MTLYHGSTVDIQRIDLAKSKPNKDFGRALYFDASGIFSVALLFLLRITYQML